MARIYVDSVSGSGTAPYDTWAKAATTIQAAITQWSGTADVIYVEDGHQDSGTTSVTISDTTSTQTNLIPIYRVDKADDSYSPTSGVDTIQINISTNLADLTITANTVWHGLNIFADDRFIISATNQTTHFYDCWFDANTNGQTFTIGNASHDGSILFKGCTFDSQGIGYLHNIRGALLRYTDCLFQLDNGINANGLFQFPINGQVRLICEGCDFSPLPSSSNIFYIGSQDCVVEADFINCDYPTSHVLVNGSFTHDDQVVRSWNSDDTGDLFLSEIYTLRGTVSTDTALYLTAGFTHQDGNQNLSRKMAPSSSCAEHAPLRSIEIPFNYTGATGSSKTFTVECIEDFTTALQNDEAWIEIYCLETAASTKHALKSSRVLAGSTKADLSPGAGLGSWTGATGKRSVKLSVSATPLATGLFKAVIYLGKYESAKALWYNPQVTVT